MLAHACSSDIIAKAEKFSAHNYHPLPVVLTRGEGVWVWDIEGKKYLDCLAAYSAVNQGHRHPQIIAALLAQAEQITLTSRAFHNDQMGEFIEELCNATGYEKALPMNTGAEAVETAIKTARKWGYKIKGVPEGQAEIIVAANNFHGRTTTIVGFSTEHQYRDGFGPFTPGFNVVPYGDAEALAAAITPNTVAFLVEPIQGEGGVVIPPRGYLRACYDACRENNVLFVADEIQTGFGRTGAMFCCDHENVKADLVVIGKALGGGVYPVSAVLGSNEYLGVFNPGDHGSTFGGNPLGSAVGLASLRVVIEEDLPGQSLLLGNYFQERLLAIDSPHVREVRGKGLMIGVEIKRESGTARPFCEALMELGILAKETHAQTIRFAPPLVIDRETIDWALERIEKVLTR
ncbi:ornithine--oxo-acid transaminase [bacterium]|nr:ornithine--oxo-acid transaminase [bacterium]